MVIVAPTTRGNCPALTQYHDAPGGGHCSRRGVEAVHELRDQPDFSTTGLVLASRTVRRLAVVELLRAVVGKMIEIRSQRRFVGRSRRSRSRR